MPFAVVLFFNKSQSIILDNIIEELAIKDVAPFMFNESIPHITLAIYNELDCEGCKERISEFSNNYKSMSLKFSHLGLFKSKMNAVVAAPTVTFSLLQMHKEFHEQFKNQGIGSWDNYLPGNWVPHCTLAFNVSNEKIDDAFSICRKIEFPFEITISSLGIMEFEPVREIYRVPFNQSRTLFK